VASCLVCQHPEQEEIEAARRRKPPATFKEISDQWGIGLGSVKRHFLNHIGPYTAAQRAAGRRVLGDPVATFREAWGLEPKPHQVEYLTEERSTLVLKGRQVGFTQAGAALAIHAARSRPGSMSLIISTSKDQSAEVARRARLGLWSLGQRMVQDSTQILRLQNGSIIKSLPGNARGVRGYSADGILIIDEAAGVEEDTFVAAMALTAATGARTIVQSTPRGPSGTFFDLWQAQDPDWARIRVSSEDVPDLVDPAFLERERRRLSPEAYAQEYLAEFGEGAVQVGITPFDEEELLSRRGDV
jgi:hypothetical protein